MEPEKPVLTRGEVIKKLSRVNLDVDDVKSHALFLGATRAGKTTNLINMLLYLLEPEVQKVFPCTPVLIDPHGQASIDLALRIKDLSKLIIIDPTYVSVGMNPMEPPTSDSASEKSLLQQTQVSELGTIMKEMFGTDMDTAPRLLWIFKSSLYYLFAISPNEPPNFADVYNLMLDMLSMDADDLKDMLRSAGVEDEIVSKTMEAISGLESAAFTAVQNRISNFVTPPDSLTSKTFCVRHSTIDLDEMLSKSGRIVVFRLSKFHLPNDYRRMMTSSLVLKLYFTIQKRAREAEKQGKTTVENNIVCAIDEFHNVADLDIVDSILSEAAKYGLFLIMAFQNFAQIDKRPGIKSAILSNVGLVVVYRSDKDDAKELTNLLGGGKELESYLPRLPNYLAIVRKNPVGGSGLAEPLWIAFKPLGPVAKNPDGTERTMNDVIDYMRNVMEPKYGHAIQDLRPIYKDKLEDIRKKQGMPTQSPVNWAILTKLLIQHEIDHNTLVQELYQSNSWDGSVTQGALTKLTQLGYVSGSVVVDPERRGDERIDPHFKGALARSQDELDRSRNVVYSLTKEGRDKFFSITPRGRRGGGPLHQTMMNFLLREYWKGGSWTTVDTGDITGQAADILVFSPKESLKNNKRFVDPNNWSPTPYAVELETYPQKSQNQVRENLAKNVKEGKPVIFVVSSPEHKIQLQDVVKDMNMPYEVRVLNFYEDPEWYRKTLQKEMEFLGVEGTAEYPSASITGVDFQAKDDKKAATKEEPAQAPAQKPPQQTPQSVPGDAKKGQQIEEKSVPPELGPGRKMLEDGHQKVVLKPEQAPNDDRKTPEGPAQKLAAPEIPPAANKTASDKVGVEALKTAQPLSNQGDMPRTSDLDEKFMMEIVKQLGRTPNIPRYKLAKLLGTSERRLNRHLQHLFDKGVVEESAGMWRLRKLQKK